MNRFDQQIRYASTPGGAKIAYATSGRGYPLVRAGHWMTHLQWDWQLPVWGPWIHALAAHRQLIRYDQRGCGLSPATADAVSLDSMLEDLEAVVDDAKLEKFALLGPSQGGAVSIAYAARHPGRVSHLVLCDAFARGALVRDPGPKQQQVLEAMCCLVEAGWGQPNSAFRQMFTSQFFPAASREQAESFNELQRLSCTPAHAAVIVRAVARFDASHHLSEVRCPTLVLHCREDSRVPFEEGRFLAAGIPGARFEVLESTNHTPLQGEPAFDRLLQVLDEFLPATAAGSGAPGFAGLSERNREIVELLARGLDNAQIAAHLGLAEKTVRNRVSDTFRILAVENRSQAIVRAREAGFGSS